MGLLTSVLISFLIGGPTGLCLIVLGLGVFQYGLFGLLDILCHVGLVLFRLFRPIVLVDARLAALFGLLLARAGRARVTWRLVCRVGVVLDLDTAMRLPTRLVGVVHHRRQFIVPGDETRHLRHDDLHARLDPEPEREQAHVVQRDLARVHVVFLDTQIQVRERERQRCVGVEELAERLGHTQRGKERLEGVPVRVLRHDELRRSDALGFVGVRTRRQVDRSMVAARGEDGEVLLVKCQAQGVRCVIRCLAHVYVAAALCVGRRGGRVGARLRRGCLRPAVHRRPKGT